MNIAQGTPTGRRSSVDAVWLAMLITINLQSSFLRPRARWRHP